MYSVTSTCTCTVFHDVALVVLWDVGSNVTSWPISLRASNLFVATPEVYSSLTCSIVYKSPQADMGYDIADYKAIDARYGTLSDMDNLIKTCKDHDMKIIMDLVVTHTSDQHDWFLESAKSKTSPKRDWYIWKPPRGYDEAGKPIPPNNWAQILGDANSAWTWSEVTKEFYLTLHTPEQVDLNWENTDVVSAVHDVSPHLIKYFSQRMRH